MYVVCFCKDLTKLAPCQIFIGQNGMITTHCVKFVLETNQCTIYQYYSRKFAF